MRLVVNPMHLFDKFEEYLFDTMALQYVESGQTVNTTIGEYVEGLLSKVKYFGTPLPRIPVKARQLLEKELAPLAQYRKRMEANQVTFKSMRINDLPVEVCIDGQWLCGAAKEYVGRVSSRRKVRVVLEDGQSVHVHLGKVVLRDGENSKSEGSGPEGNKRKRSRSRSRKRAGSPDWSRYKGRSHQEMAHEFHEKSKEEALCTAGKSYAKRPFTMEEELWRSEAEVRVSMLGDHAKRSGSGKGKSKGEDAVESEITKRRKQEEEMERQSRMRAIYEKYGSTSAAKKTSTSSDVDLPDVLRLG